ncbi:MAG: sulfite exporter TauE/SafE family protein [Solirubrobacteraceae bacterium]
MSLAEIVCIALAGMAAGTINTVVGSGTLITFPVLLAFGYAPVTANVTNTVGLVPGSVSGAVGYRRELAGQRRRAVRLGTMSVLGSLTGAVLLLVLPAAAFKAIVPVFIGVALVLTVCQPRLAAALARRQIDLAHPRAAATLAAVYLTGVYGGYFGAAQGIMLLAILGVALDQDLHRTNALKNVLAGLANGVAGLYFAFAAHVDWGVAGLIAGGAIVGGQLGARYGRRVPPRALRALIVVVGVAAILQLLLG